MDKYDSISVVYDMDEGGEVLQIRQFRKQYVGHDTKFGMQHLPTTKMHKSRSPCRLGK